MVVFSVLAASLAALSVTNAQVASIQHKVNGALFAAQSGLECAKYLVNTVTGLEDTSTNSVTDAQANTTWTKLYLYLQANALDGHIVPAPSRFTDTLGSGDQFVIPEINFGSPDVLFTIRLYRYDADLRTIKLESTGTDGEATRKIRMDMKITKDSPVLNYAIASRGRMWLTGDTTIHGSVYSSWNRQEISPYNMTDDSKVNGTIGTVLTLDQIKHQSYQLETLNAQNRPIDANGTPLDTNYEDRYYSLDDEIQAYHRGINYGQPFKDMRGMSIADYDTSCYRTGLTDVATTTSKVTEYFPHAAGNYSSPGSSGSKKLTRYKYENKTYSNVRLPNNRNALFKNCTFNNILYIDCSTAGSSYYNNVRFENCNFNGVIVTNVPQVFKWMDNCLYFTGTASFNNTTGIESTILAPHFNVNLGNTNPQRSDNNVLTGAIVGGIVDVRGNAQIYGTIISMCDTTQWTSGYVTNIGATLGDGGSETTEVGDVGVISITPQEDKMLPSGIKTPIVINPNLTSYSEGV
jgi:hypothetical protein